MVKKLEAQLVISAADKTGAVFNEVGARFDRIAAAGKRIDGVGRSFLNVGSAIDSNARSLAAAGSKVDLLHSRMVQLDRIFHKNIGSISGLTQALGTGVAAMSAYHAAAALFEHTARAASEGQHERVRMEAAGMTPAESAEAEKITGELSGKYPSLSQTTLLHMLRNARAIVGSFEEAKKLIEPLAKLRIVAEGGHPERAQELEGDFDKLEKSMEMVGATMDIGRFTRDMDLVARALNSFGDTLRPSDFYDFAKYARAAGQGYSDQFLLGVGPTLTQEMGGKSAGTAMASFYQQFVGGKMSKAAVLQMEKFGLVDPAKVIKTGSSTWMLPPGALLRSDLAKSDPAMWIHEVLLPALAAHGVVTKEQIEDTMAVLGSKQTTGQALGIFATQWSRIQKDLELEHGALGLESYKNFQQKDPAVALKGFTEQLNNLMQVAGGPLAEPAASFFNSMATSIGHMAQYAREHPVAQNAATGGLIGLLSGVATGLWEGGLWLLRNRLSPGMLSTLRWAPVTGIRALTSGAAGMALPFYLSTKDAFISGNREIDEALAKHYRGAPWLSDEGPPSTLATPPAELKGEATVHVHVTVGHEGIISSDTSIDNHIDGLRVRGGTTGRLGTSFDDAVSGR